MSNYGFTLEQEAILINEMRRPDKELLLRTLRESAINIIATPEMNSGSFAFSAEEELREIYDDLIGHVEKLTDEEIYDLFHQLPMLSDLE